MSPLLNNFSEACPMVYRFFPPLALIRFRYSFICQGTLTMRQRSDLFGFRVKLPPGYYQSNH